jgi:transcription antitermination factor NusG
MMTTQEPADRPSWGVVEVRPNMEPVAERSLQRLGYEPLVVRYNKLIRGCRIAPDGRRIRSRKDEIQARPFIPGYLFLPIVQGDDASEVDGQLGIKRLFRQRDAEGYLGKPKLIRARIVEQIVLAAQERDETPKAVRADLKPGQRVRIPGGIEAVLLSLDEKGRVRYVAEMFGGQVVGSIENASQLELVEAKC